VLDAKLPARERTADFVAIIEHAEKGRFLLLVEFQTGCDSSITLRMLEYRTRPSSRYPD
jgi:hypothetical protein